MFCICPSFGSVVRVLYFSLVLFISVRKVPHKLWNPAIRIGKHEVNLDNIENMENMEKNIEKMENINQMTNKHSFLWDLWENLSH